jgi:hypothetical protein
MSLTMNKRELPGPQPQVAHGPGFQDVNEVSGPIEPYRAVPLLANSNALNANGLATSASEFRGNSCWIEEANSRMATFAYEMRLAGTDRVLATGHTRHIFVNREMRRARLPEKYHAMFGVR